MEIRYCSNPTTPVVNGQRCDSASNDGQETTTFWVAVREPNKGFF